MQEISRAAKATLVASASMTVMAGAIIAPALPGIGVAFAHVPNASTLAPLVLTITSLAIALCAFPAGILCDRLGCKRVLLGSLLVYALTGTFGLYTDSLHQLLASRFALGFAVSGVMTSANTLVADLFDGPRRLTLLGLKGAALSLGAVVFLVTGGFLAEASWRYPFALYSLSLLIFASVALYIKEPPLPTRSADLEAANRLGKSLSLKIAFLYATSFCGMLLFYLVASQLPFLLRSKFESTPAVVGTVIAVSNFFGAVSAFNYRRLRRFLSPQHSFALGFFLIAMAFSLIAHAPSLPLFFIAMAAAGLGIGLIGPNANSTLADLIPPGQRGRYFGGLTTSVFVGQFLAPLSIQYFVLSHGYQGFLGAFSAASLFALVVSGLYLSLRPPFSGLTRAFRQGRGKSKTAPTQGSKEGVPAR